MHKIRDLMKPVFQPIWVWAGRIKEAQHIYQ